MFIAPRIYDISKRGLETLSNGEDIYKNWTFYRIFEEVFRIKEEDEESVPINYELLHQVHIEVLREYLLYKSSWHHVNGEKVWFYKLDEELIRGMTEDNIQEMIDETVTRCSLVNKPRLVKAVTYKWVRSANNQHDTVYRREGYGVLYNSDVYFISGAKYPVSPDKCVVTHRYDKGVPKNKRELFDGIRHEMRKYAIYC